MKEEVPATPVEEAKEEVAETPVEEVKEEKKEEVKEEKKAPKKPLTPKTDYVSKFEDFAGSGKKEETKTPARRRKKKDDDDRRVRAEDLEKKEYGDIKPEYSEEELEEIALQEQELEENSWINDDDIDFDEYDEYYEEDNY